MKYPKIRSFQRLIQNLRNFIYLELVQKANSFDLSVDTEISFFRVSVAIEPSRFLLTVCYRELLYKNKSFFR